MSEINYKCTLFGALFCYLSICPPCFIVFNGAILLFRLVGQEKTRPGLDLLVLLEGRLLIYLL